VCDSSRSVSLRCITILYVTSRFGHTRLGYIIAAVYLRRRNILVGIENNAHKNTCGGGCLHTYHTAQVLCIIYIARSHIGEININNEIYISASGAPRTGFSKTDYATAPPPPPRSPHDDAFGSPKSRG